MRENDYVSLSVHLDPPPWYVEQNAGFEDHWEQMLQNIGSEKWKRDAADYMCALIDKMEEWYPGRVYAIFLLCGGTTEWYSYKPDIVIENPTEIQKRSFSEFCGDVNAQIPSPEVLHSASDGVIRDSIKQKDAIKYWEFTNEAVMNAILYFAKIAKEHTNRTKLVGLFSGHIYGQNLDWAVRTSYNRPDMLLHSEDIDMIFTPASYLTRKLSSTSGIRSPIDSITLHGKLFVHEIDSATHLMKNTNNITSPDMNAAKSHAGRDGQFTCTEDTVAYLRREAGMILAKGQRYWWFDMFSGYYDDPQLMNELENIHSIQEKLLSKEAKPTAQVIEMLDIRSNYHLATKSFYPMAEHQNEALNKCGFPWDMGMTFDMMHEDFDSDRYKLFIFPALFAPDDEIKSKIADMRKKGKCMLYMHAPYYAADNGLSVESMKKYTDMEFEKLDLSDNTAGLCFEGACGISYDFDNRTIVGDIWQNKDEINRIKPVFTVTNADVILARFRENGLPACGIKFRADGGFDAFSACAPMPTELLRKIAEYAGVFSYCDKNIPIYTNSAFECVYPLETGEYTLSRPNKAVLTDCFTGEKITVLPQGTRIALKQYETKWYYVEEAEEKA